MDTPENKPSGQPLGLALTEGLGLAETAALCARQCHERHRHPECAKVEQGYLLNAAMLLEQCAAELERCQPDGLKFDALGEPRTRYVRVSLDGSHCVMHPSEGDRYLQDARDADDSAAERYIVRDVWLSEREFDDLPEFDGF